MEYAVYKLNFTTPVHFGTGALSTGTMSFCADTLFSALYIEAMHHGCNQELYEMASEGSILLSDAFPYIGDRYFLPKPMRYVEPQSRERGNSTAKKKFKKLRYIPVDQIKAYLSGNMNPDDASLSTLGHEESQTMAAVRTDGDTLPYVVGNYVYHDGNGLYIIAGYENDDCKMLLDDLLDSLSYSGIGGKRGSGKGRFQLLYGRNTETLQQLLQNSTGNEMLLSTALPMESELESALEGASYLLQKRSGFVYSETYAEEARKKRDLYTMQAGSCFANRFVGDIYDVSEQGAHPVYRYAKGMFLGLPVASGRK